MSKVREVWVFIEQEAGQIAAVSLELLSKARDLADELSAQEQANETEEPADSYNVYAVGGLPRDLILGRPNWDVDIVVEGDGIAFAKAHRPQLSSVTGGGIAYDGATGTPYRGQAPGRIGRESGKHIRADHLVISSQADLNDKLGRLLASRSSQQDELTLENYYDIWEPALQEYLSITVAAADNPRGIAFGTDDLWIVRRVEIDDVMGKTPTVRTTCELLVPEGTATGVAVPIPDPVVEETRKRIILVGDVPSPANPPVGCNFVTRCPVKMDVCEEKEPEFKEVSQDHWVACWRVN